MTDDLLSVSRTRPRLGASSGLTRRPTAAVSALVLASALVAACEDDPPAVVPGTPRDGGSVDASLPRPPSDAVCLSLVHAGNGASRYGEDEEAGLPGYEAFVAAVEDARAAAPMSCQTMVPDDDPDSPVLTVWTGDVFAPSVTAEVSLNLGGALSPGIGFDARLYGPLEFDVMVVGDRDLAFGPEVLADFIVDLRSELPARRPFLASTLDVSAEPDLARLTEEDGPPPEDGGMGMERRLLFREVVVTAADRRIGFVSAIRPDLASASSPRGVEAFEDSELVSALETSIGALRGAGDAERVVLIAHTASVEGDLALARSLTGVDLVLSAGDPGASLAPPGVILDAAGLSVPVAAVAGGYRQVGLLQVYFPASGAPRVLRQAEAVLDVDPAGTSPVVRPILSSLDEALNANPILADSEVTLDSQDVQTADTNGGHLVADAILWEARDRANAWNKARPVQAAIVPAGQIGSIRDDPAGFAEATLRLLVPGDGVVAVTEDLLGAEQVKLLLEAAVAELPAPSDRFVQVAGMTVVVDPDGVAQEIDDAGLVTTEGTRIVDVVLDDGTPLVEEGAPVTTNQARIAAPGFVYDGTGGYPILDGVAPRRLGVSLRSALRGFLDARVEDGGLDGRIPDGTYGAGAPPRIEGVPDGS